MELIYTCSHVTGQQCRPRWSWSEQNLMIKAGSRKYLFRSTYKCMTDLIRQTNYTHIAGRAGKWQSEQVEPTEHGGMGEWEWTLAIGHHMTDLNKYKKGN